MGFEIAFEQYGATTTPAADNTAKKLGAGVVSNDPGATSSLLGDAVEISEEGRTLAMRMGGTQKSGAKSGDGQGGAASVGSEESESEDENMAVRRIKERIKQLQQQLKEVQEDESLTEKEKTAKIQEINQELAELSKELGKQSGATFNGAIQGTRCKYAV